MSIKSQLIEKVIEIAKKVNKEIEKKSKLENYKDALIKEITASGLSVRVVSSVSGHPFPPDFIIEIQGMLFGIINDRSASVQESLNQAHTVKKLPIAGILIFGENDIEYFPPS